MTTTPEEIVSTIAPTRNPETTVMTLLKSMPRVCCGENRNFDASETYFYIDRSVVAVVIGLWLVCLVVYLIWAVCRRWCWSCQRPSHFLSKKPLKASAKQRMFLACWICLLMLLYSGTTAFSHRMFLSASRRAVSTTDDLERTFGQFEAWAEILVAESQVIDDATKELTCDGGGETAFRQASDILDDATAETLSSVEDVDSKFRAASRKITKAQRTYIFWSFLGSVIVVLWLLPPSLYGCTLSSRWALHVASKIGIFVGTVLAVVSSISFGVGATLADFCRRPDDHFHDVVQDRMGLSQDAEDVVLYYSTCNGVNPLFGPLATARADVLLLNTTASQASDGCDPDSALDSITSSSSTILHVIDLFTADVLDCSYLNGRYQRLVHSATCRSLLSGFYAVAVQNAIAAAFIIVFLFATNWVCETILLEEEYFLQPHPEIFAITTYAGTSNQIDLDIGDDNSDLVSDDDSPHHAVEMPRGATPASSSRRRSNTHTVAPSDSRSPRHSARQDVVRL